MQFSLHAQQSPHQAGRLPGFQLHRKAWHGAARRRPQPVLPDRRPCVVSSQYNGGRRPPPGGRQRPPAPLKSEDLLRLALPAAGLVAAAMLIGPLVAGVLTFVVGSTFFLATSMAVLSVSWMLLPFLVGMVALPMFLFGPLGLVGVAAGAFALPLIAQLAMLGAALWAGGSLAQYYLSKGQDGGAPDPDGTIDVEADTVEDWSREADKEEQRRKKELDEFDELLRRREAFKRKEF